MTETNYKLTLTSLEFKDPAPFTNTTMSTTTLLDKNVFEVSTTTQTKKEMGLTRTVYHGQTKIETSSITDIIPFFEITASTANELINIGKVILHITYINAKDNSSKPQFLRLVGAPQANGAIGTTIQSASTGVANSDALLGTNADIYKSNFYLDGINPAANTTQKWIIDLNKQFKIVTSGERTALGLEFNVAPIANTTIYIDAYTEVITV